MAKLTFKMDYDHEDGDPISHRDIELILHVPWDATLTDMHNGYIAFLKGLTFPTDKLESLLNDEE